MTKKEKVASGVIDFYVSEDGYRIIYITEEEEIYIRTGDGRNEKVDSGSYISIIKTSDDCSDFYYAKDRSLYRKTEGKNAIEIASYYDGVYFINKDSGYFWKTEGEQVNIYKLGLCVGQCSVYYFDNENVTKVLNFYGSFHDVRLAEENGQLLGIEYVFPEESGSVLAGLSGEEMEYIEENIGDVAEPVLFSCSGETVTTMELPTVEHRFAISSSGDLFYYIGDIDNEMGTGDLYRVDIVDGEIQTPLFYDSDIYISMMQFMPNNQILYFKDYKDGSAECYLDRKELDYDVLSWGFKYNEKENTILYYTDWDRNWLSGTLKEYCQGESLKIADDVHSYEVTKNGSILYLGDYDVDHQEGNLYLYNGKESILLDEDVTHIITFY